MTLCTRQCVIKTKKKQSFDTKGLVSYQFSLALKSRCGRFKELRQPLLEVCHVWPLLAAVPRADLAFVIGEDQANDNRCAHLSRGWPYCIGYWTELGHRPSFSCQSTDNQPITATPCGWCGLYSAYDFPVHETFRWRICWISPCGDELHVVPLVQAESVTQQALWFGHILKRAPFPSVAARSPH